MTEHQLYLPTVIPQWGIFLAIALVIIGYVDKKEKWAYGGWALFVATALAALWFNLFGGFAPQPGDTPSEQIVQLVTAGWLTVAGGALALASLLFLYFKLKRYSVLAVLTLLFFAVIFFQYNTLIRGNAKAIPAKTEQTK